MITQSLIIYYVMGVGCALGISVAIFFCALKKNWKIPRMLFIGMVIGSFYMLFAQLLKYYTLHFYGDFAHWAQVFYNIVTVGKPLCLTLEFHTPGAMNYFSVHFTPLLYILALAFKLFPHNETIICLNVLLMLSAAIPLYKLAFICQRDRPFALFAATLLLWYPTFQYTVLYEFEMLRFAVPIILWMLYFWERKNMPLYFLFVVLAVLVREEVGLTIMMFGVYLTVARRKYREGFLTMCVGAAAFLLITQKVMPALRSGGGYTYIAMKSFSAFGDNLIEIITNIFKHPLFAVRFMMNSLKAANIFMFFLPLLFIPLLAPEVLLATAANFGVGLLSSSDTHISYMLFYLAPSIPFIFYAFIKAWPRLMDILGNSMPSAFNSRNRAPAAMAAVFAGTIVTNIFFGPSPLSFQFWLRELRPAPFKTQDFHYSVYMLNAHHSKVTEFCDAIPPTAIVSAHRFLQPRVSKKGGVVLLGDHNGINGQYKADYVFFDKTNNNIRAVSPAYRSQRDFDEFENNTEKWKLVKSNDGYYLYKRVEEHEKK